MTTLAAAVGTNPQPDLRRAIWARHGAALTLVAVALIALFARDAADMARIWWTNTTFGHCLFVGPVIAWLVWTRRAALAQLTPVAWAPGLLLVAGGGAGWMLGEAAGVALARHLGVVMMLQGATVTLLGPNVARGVLFPLAYALFLVPFGEEIEPPLQTITVAMTMPLLHLVGVPASVDGVLITIPNGYFEVAEACSGSKFVLAMAAYAALVANLCFRSWRRRAVFVVAALIIPVLANGVRAFGTIWAAHLTSVETATGADHIVFGWIFFGLVMAAVLALGWRWFDRAPDDPAFDPATLQTPPRHAFALPLAALLVLGGAALFPGWASGMRSEQALPAHIDLPAVPGWARTDMSMRAPWQPYYPGANHFLIGRYSDGADAVDLSIAVLAGQREGQELVAFGVGVLRENDRWVRVTDEAPIAGGSVMRITAPGGVERLVATWWRIGDTLTADPARAKLATLKVRLLGGPQRAVAIHISAEIVPGRDPRAAIARFVAALGPLDRLADRSAGMN